MEAEVVTRIAELAKGQTQKHQIGAEELLVHDGDVIGVAPVRYPLPEPLVVHTLTGLRGYVAANRDALLLADLAVHVVSPSRVDVLGKTLERTHQRPVHVRAECYDRFAAVPNFKFSQFLSHETMVIGLHALFAPTAELRELLVLLSNVEQGEVRTDEDDGVSQKVTVRTGISMAAERRIPNPVVLQPFRTFVEIEQPPSTFVFRMRQGDAQSAAVALFEADGGAWRDEAVASIRDWLDGSDELSTVAVLA